MNCPLCGRALAAGARKCVFCGDGTKFRPNAQLQIPKGTVPEPKSSFPWGKLLLFLILAGAVAAAWLNPELNAKIRSFLPK